MVDDARIDAGAAAYRGFLFSDIRGFTSFAERYGNTAAAAKVSRFLDIARTAIARHEGAEIKTEGDAIHAVFPSASSAVLCGLEIVEAAALLSAQEPDGWFDLGVGVHAGEAVETAEGYIGRAVNIAARLCAVARPGEVLVSSTVKGITQASIAVGFIPKGKRRLKGIQDPILVYAVTRDMNARASRAIPRPVLIGAVGVAAAVVVAIAILGSQIACEPRLEPFADREACGAATAHRASAHREVHNAEVPATGHLRHRRPGLDGQPRPARGAQPDPRCRAAWQRLVPARAGGDHSNRAPQAAKARSHLPELPTCSPSSGSSSI